MTRRRKALKEQEKDVFFSRGYGPRDAATGVFTTLALGYNRCAAKLDYTDFLRRHPSRHRFSATGGRTLASLVLVHIVSGHGRFRSGPSGEMPVPANSIFFVFPGVNHFYRYDDETGWNEQWLELDAGAVLPLLAEAGVTPESPLRTLSSATSVTEAFQSLFDLASSEPADGGRWRVDAAAHRVVAEALALWKSGDDASTPAARAVERMREALVSDLTDARLVADAAQVAGMSPSRMRSLFKKATGLSPKKYQMRARLVRAGRLLRETDWPVAAVAAQTGFASLFSFSRRFTKLLGFSPTEYRRRKTAVHSDPKRQKDQDR